MWLINLRNSRLLVLPITFFVVIPFCIIWCVFIYFIVTAFPSVAWPYLFVLPILFLVFYGAVWRALFTDFWIIDFKKCKLSCINVLRFSISRDIHFREVRAVETSAVPSDDGGVQMNIWLELLNDESVFLQEGYVFPYKNILRLQELLRGAILDTQLQK